MLAAVGQMGSCGVGWDTDSSGPNSGAQHRTWRVARRGGGRGHLPQHLLSGSSAALHEPGPPHRPGTAPPYQHPVTGPPAPDLPLPPCRLLPSTPGSALLVPARPVPFRSADGGARWPEVAGRWHRDALRCTPVRWRPAMQDETLPDVPLKKKGDGEPGRGKTRFIPVQNEPQPRSLPQHGPPLSLPPQLLGRPRPGRGWAGDPGAGAAGSSPPRGGARGGGRGAGAVRGRHPTPQPARQVSAGGGRAPASPPGAAASRCPIAAAGRGGGGEAGTERIWGPEPTETSPRGGLLKGGGTQHRDGNPPLPSTKGRGYIFTRSRPPRAGGKAWLHLNKIIILIIIINN